VTEANPGHPPFETQPWWDGRAARLSYSKVPGLGFFAWLTAGARFGPGRLRAVSHWTHPGGRRRSKRGRSDDARRRGATTYRLFTLRGRRCFTMIARSNAARFDSPLWRLGDMQSAAMAQFFGGRGRRRTVSTSARCFRAARATAPRSAGCRNGGQSCVSCRSSFSGSRTTGRHFFGTLSRPRTKALRSRQPPIKDARPFRSARSVGAPSRRALAKAMDFAGRCRSAHALAGSACSRRREPNRRTWSRSMLKPLHRAHPNDSGGLVPANGG